MSCELNANPTCDAVNRLRSWHALTTRISGSRSRYQAEFRGIAEYYQLAYNRHRLGLLRWIMERSLMAYPAGPGDGCSTTGRYAKCKAPRRCWVSSANAGGVACR